MLKFTKAAALRDENQPAAQDTLQMIPISQIRPNPYQPRKYFSDEAIRELSSSIRQIGLLQPINVRQIGPERYEVIAGERRLRASKLAGLTHIKAIVRNEAYDTDVAMIAMIENLQRENLHFLRKQRAIRISSGSITLPRRTWPGGSRKTSLPSPTSCAFCACPGRSRKRSCSMA